jgi:hypothetical protein
MFFLYSNVDRLMMGTRLSKLEIINLVLPLFPTLSRTLKRISQFLLIITELPVLLLVQPLSLKKLYSHVNVLTSETTSDALAMTVIALFVKEVGLLLTDMLGGLLSGIAETTVFSSVSSISCSGRAAK